jgi:hypothetical protein
MRRAASTIALALALVGGAAHADQPRRLAYEAHEATWAQPTISPDGAWLWFDLLGDIYRMPVAGGTAQPVFTGTAFERNPVPSPDGQWIAFISDRSGVTALWIARNDGSEARALTHDTSLVLMTSPAWAPDGKSVFVSRAVHSILAFELWRVPVDGGAAALIVKAQPGGNEGWDERINALGAAPSPDGRSVWFATKRGHTWTEKDPPTWSIARQDLATGAVETVVPGGMRPVLSPDGTLLAYAARRDGVTAETSETGLRLRNLATGEDRWLAWPMDHDGQEGGYYYDLTPGFRFTPDGKALIAARNGGFVRIDVASGAQTPIPFTAPVDLALAPPSRVRQRVEDGPTVRSHLAEGTALSPDGRTVAFTALGTLYVAGSRGGAPRALFAGDAFQPAWSPDGRTIAFVRWSAEHGGGVWTVSAQGGTPHLLGTQGAYWSEPRWSRDGSGVVALRASAYDRLHAPDELAPAWPVDVVALGVSGATPRVLAHGAGLHHLQQTDDGTWYVNSDGALARVTAAGTLEQRATIVARAAGQYVKEPRPVDELRISPDGRQLVARTAFELHLLPTPADAKPVNLADTASGARQITRVGADTMRWDGRGLSWTTGPFWHHADAATLAKADPEAASPPRDLSVRVARALPARPQVLRGATVLTMDHAAVIQDADLVITGDRITALGPRGSVALPKGAQVRELAGKFVIPGLIDAHAHFFPIPRVVHDATHWEFPALLAYGVTSVLEVQPFTPDIFAYGDRIDAGLSVGPRLFSTGPGVFVNSEITSQAVAEDVLTRYKDAYRTRNIKSYMVGDRAARQAMIGAARKLGMMPTTEGAADFMLELTHAIDGFAGNEHDLPITPIHDDVARLFKASEVAYTPTINVAYGGGPLLFDEIENHAPQDDARLRRFTPPFVLAAKLRDRHWTAAPYQTWQRFAADAVNLRRAGVLVGVGSHGEMQGIGVHWEMASFVAGGATPTEALEMATIDNARVIGRADDLGSVTPGKLADLVVLDADPRADIANARRIAMVLRGGIAFDGTTLAREGMAPTAPWWQDLRP